MKYDKVMPLFYELAEEARGDILEIGPRIYDLTEQEKDSGIMGGCERRFKAFTSAFREHYPDDEARGSFLHDECKFRQLTPKSSNACWSYHFSFRGGDVVFDFSHGEPMDVSQYPKAAFHNDDITVTEFEPERFDEVYCDLILSLYK